MAPLHSMPVIFIILTVNKASTERENPTLQNSSWEGTASTVPTHNQCKVDKKNPQKEDPEHRLLKDLMRNYDPNVRPIIDKTKPVHVKFDLAFNQIVELVSELLLSVDKKTDIDTKANTAGKERKKCLKAVSCRRTRDQRTEVSSESPLH